MIICIIIATLFIALSGMVVLNEAVKRAPVGYEDGHGFHATSDSQHARALSADLHASAAAPIGWATEEEFHTLRLLSRGVRQ
jgi:hypothetical protein